MVGRRQRRMGGNEWRRRLALITLSKEAEGVDLPNEIGDASPASEPETHHKDPYHYECVYCIHGSPAWHKWWWLLCSILHLYFKQNLKKKKH